MANVKRKLRVRFSPDNVDITVPEGWSLLKAALSAGVHINAACGGNGVCGTCKVLIRKGEVESTRSDKLSAEEYQQGYRLACQSRVLSDLVVDIPVESRLETAVLSREMKMATAEAKAAELVATGWGFNPPLSKCYVELEP